MLEALIRTWGFGHPMLLLSVMCHSGLLKMWLISISVIYIYIYIIGFILWMLNIVAAKTQFLIVSLQESELRVETQKSCWCTGGCITAMKSSNKTPAPLGDNRADCQLNPSPIKQSRNLPLTERIRFFLSWWGPREGRKEEDRGG